MGLGNALGQSQVNTVQAPAVEGDFCNINPRATVDAGQFGLVSGSAGVTVGRFAWVVSPGDNDDSPSIVTNASPFGGLPAGFVHREQQGLNVTYLSDASMVIQPGFPVTLFSAGGFWVKNNGTAEALLGQKAYAKYADGTIRFGVTGSPTAGGSGTASTIATGSFSVTGTIANGVLTVTVVGSGTIWAGSILGGTNIPAVSVVSQLTGTTGGVGTYLISSNSLTISTSQTITGSYGTLTIGGTVVSGFAVGQLVNGTNVAAGTYITALNSGTGGAGTYIVNISQSVSSTTITGYTDIETKYYATSQGQVGSLVKMSSVSED